MQDERRRGQGQSSGKHRCLEDTGRRQEQRGGDGPGESSSTAARSLVPKTENPLFTFPPPGGWMEGWKEGWTDGWMDGRMEEAWMDGRKDKLKEEGTEG